MWALAERIESGEATGAERMVAALILRNSDTWPKHSFKKTAEAERDREIATFVDFIARAYGEKTTNVVEQWATKEYGLGRSAIWERIKRGRLLPPRKVKEDAINVGRLEPDGDGGFKWFPPDSPVKTQN
jgi:hypothetical protein